MKNNKTRKEKYLQLKKAGFTSKEANILKDRSQKKVDELCYLNKQYIEQRNDFIKSQSNKRG